MMQELQKAFPKIEFITSQGHHSTKTITSLQSCERVISVNTDSNSMNQLTDKMLAKHFEDRYLRINGGMSSVKRQVQMWIHAGVLK
jgi:predicted ATP-binding protein involved in virulence